MTLFVALAALLAAIACTFVVVPLLRARPDGAFGRASVAAVAAAGALLVGGAALYSTWSNWSWSAAPAADTPQGMVARLARRLERKPEDLEGWLMLGRSYAVLGQYPLAVRAYQRADRLADGRNVEAIVGLAEALTLENEEELAGRAGRLFERALELEPRSGKALFFGAVAALRRGELPLARERFATLLALDPPQNVRPLLEREIAAIDRELGGAVAGTPGAAATASRASGGAGEPAVKVRVVAGPDLPRGLEASPLFVIVRDPRSPGPPLAVKRLAARLPQEVTLTAADSMLAGRSFAQGQSVEVVARIARSASATGASGDPFGQLRYDVGRDGLREVVIDRVMP